MGNKKKGQVWVETVIYTLIGLSIIGLVLAGALPKINAKKDEVVIEQSIEALRLVDDKIYEVSRVPGNRRIINLEVKKGALIIDPMSDEIYWLIDSSFEYSETETTIPFGNIDIITREKGDYEVELRIDYGADIRYDNDNYNEHRFDIAAVPYRLIIENMGRDIDGKSIIDIKQV